MKGTQSSEEAGAAGRSAQVGAAAVHWWQRFSQDDITRLPAEELEKWAEWSEEQSHIDQFRTVKQIWQGFGVVTQGAVSRPTDAEVATDDYDGSVPLSEWMRGGSKTHSGWRRRPLVSFLAAACLVGAVGAVVHFGQRSFLERLFGDQVQSFTTGFSEHRQIVLSDGSTITLGARTQLSTHYTLERRVVFLERGEAWFSVAGNPLRPFSVIAGGGAITAIGTQFDVRREIGSADVDRVVVTVGTGAVEVGPPDASDFDGNSHQDTKKDDFQPKWTTARLVRGQALAYDSDGPKGNVHSVDVKSVAAWTEGRLEYRHIPFKIVIPQVNRYSQKPIVLADVAVEDMPYSGTVFEGQVSDWLQALQAAYPIDVAEGPDRITIRSRTLPDPSAVPSDPATADP